MTRTQIVVQMRDVRAQYHAIVDNAPNPRDFPDYYCDPASYENAHRAWAETCDRLWGEYERLASLRKENV